MDLRLSYSSPCMKREVDWYVERCITFHIVKVEHQSLHGYLQPLDIPMYEWIQITMDFITKFLKRSHSVDTIWVIVNYLTKSAHFVPI